MTEGLKTKTLHTNKSTSFINTKTKQKKKPTKLTVAILLLLKT